MLCLRGSVTDRGKTGNIFLLYTRSGMRNSMALDGICVSALVRELSAKLTEGRVSKIVQPERDELLLTIKNNREQYRLALSASAGLPFAYLTENNKMAPLTAPNFCMLLRKHLSGGRIVSVTQPGFERIIFLEFEHLDEMGDLRRKRLAVELMGKHSNLIFIDDEDKILDAIKHVPSTMSSVREVLPGRTYFIPQTVEKISPADLTEEAFAEKILSKNMPVGKAIYTSLTGFSPLAANEICHLASLDADDHTSSLGEAAQVHLYRTLARFIREITEEDPSCSIIYDGEKPVDFASFPLTVYEGSGYRVQQCGSVSEMLEEYYAARNTVSRIRQKSVDLRRITANAIDRAAKKQDLLVRQIRDTEKRDKYRIWGELLTTYGYEAEEGAASITVTNYYDGQEMTIPLDPQLSAMQNAKKYFDRYAKLKRTYEASLKQLEECEEELAHLDSVAASLEIALAEEDLVQVRQELAEAGYLKKNTSGKARRERIISRPFHYISSDGYDIFVGKNNYQNDELTMRQAAPEDWWFHAKGYAGSHVLVKNPAGGVMPDKVYEEAAALAAYYSKGRTSPKVEVDYTQRKNIKKPGGAKPGYVVYYSNYSMVAEPSTAELKEVRG